MKVINNVSGRLFKIMIEMIGKKNEAKFAREIGLTKDAIWHNLRGSMPGGDAIIKIVKCCNKKGLYVTPDDKITTEAQENIPVDADWILYGANPNYNQSYV